jgi:hypothetical protein
MQKARWGHSPEADKSHIVLHRQRMSMTCHVTCSHYVVLQLHLTASACTHLKLPGLLVIWSCIQGCAMACSGVRRSAGSQRRHFSRKSTKPGSWQRSTLHSDLEPGLRALPGGAAAAVHSCQHFNIMWGEPAVWGVWCTAMGCEVTYKKPQQ